MKKETIQSGWVELINGQDRFQRIVQLMVDFDEGAGRVRRMTDPSTHYLRKAASVAWSDSIKVFLLDRGGFEYEVVVEMETENGFFSTRWIHEDGIKVERESYLSDPDHPVHEIECLTDLIEKYGVSVNQLRLSTLNVSTLDLLDTEHVRKEAS